MTSRALNEDDWSCGAEDPARRLSDESNYVSLEYALTPSHRHRLQVLSFLLEFAPGVDEQLTI